MDRIQEMNNIIKEMRIENEAFKLRIQDLERENKVIKTDKDRLSLRLKEQSEYFNELANQTTEKFRELAGVIGRTAEILKIIGVDNYEK